MAAAARVIASQGLGAPTALIAKEAGVSNGSLFTYFETKAELLNQLYVELKTEMAAAARKDLTADDDPHAQMASMWSGWIHWALADHDRRRALAQLTVSDEITAASRAIGNKAMAEAVQVLARCCEKGPMRDAPLGLVAALMNAAADATVDFILQSPDDADAHSQAGFEAVWRMIT